MKNPSRFSRREFVTLGAAGLSMAVPKHVRAFAQKEAPSKRVSAVSADQSWRDLLDGNSRLREGNSFGPAAKSRGVSWTRGRAISGSCDRQLCGFSGGRRDPV